MTSSVYKGHAAGLMAVIAEKKNVELLEKRFERARARRQYRTLACLLRFMSITRPRLSDLFYQDLSEKERKEVIKYA